MLLVNARRCEIWKKRCVGFMISEAEKLIDLGRFIDGPVKSKLYELVEKPCERVLCLDSMNKAYTKVVSQRRGSNFFEIILPFIFLTRPHGQILIYLTLKCNQYFILFHWLSGFYQHFCDFSIRWRTYLVFHFHCFYNQKGITFLHFSSYINHHLDH